jgi:hypothetical protein
MKGRMHKESGLYILLAMVIIRAADAGDKLDGFGAALASDRAREYSTTHYFGGEKLKEAE